MARHVLRELVCGMDGYFLSRLVPTFQRTFTSLGAELPIPTRVAIATCTPAILWPLSIVSVVFLVVKELKLERIRTKAIVSTVFFMATACVSSLVTEAIFQPMFQLMAKIR